MKQLSYSGTYPEKRFRNEQCIIIYKRTALLLLLLAISFMTYIRANAQDILTGLTSSGGPEGMGTAFSIKSTGTNFSIVKSFADWGKAPYEGLLLGSDGNYYGMTSTGGTFNNGTVFKMTAAGAISILHQFSAPTDGGNPYGSLVKGSDGNFYGMTSIGGTNGVGTIFKITTGGIYTVLKAFSGATDGSKPMGHLTLATDGNFYGITQGGGTYGGGTFFKFTASGTFTALKHFNTTTEGNSSLSSLVQGTDGNFYGLTNRGGTYGTGTIFKISPDGKTYTIIKSINETADGKYPNANNMIVGKDGNFYGMISYGGKNGGGTIFKLTPSGTFTVIRHLAAGTDGCYPYGSLYQHSDGYLYGMTQYGGANNGGTIFKISTDGTTFSVLRVLSLTEGDRAKGGFIAGSDGNLYGMTTEGGANLYGIIFKITTGGTFTVLSNMNGAAYGNAPYESLIQSKNNTFYGTTSGGGANDWGTVFKICGGSITNLHSFNRTADGARPKGSLLEANDGNLYGLTSEGGTYNVGTLFKITPAGAFTLLHHFQNTEGAYPAGSLIQASDGNIYGMTNSGGTYGGGTIFKISLGGVFTVLKHLSSNADGANPEGALTEGKDGYLYGLNHSKVFKISTTGSFSVLHTLATAEGFNPGGNLILYDDGKFYGTTSAGGKYNAGTVFRVAPDGTLDTLRSFKPANDGGVPKGSLVRGSDGYLYGITSTGGAYNAGTIFKISPSKKDSSGNYIYTVLRSLNLLTDGGAPLGSLIVQHPSPVANAQKVTTGEDTAKTITLTGNSNSGLSLTFAITTPPKNGKLSGSGANRIYTPNPNFNGKDSFYFTANVSCQQSAPAKVNITVTPVNDTPVLAPIGNKTVVVNTTLNFTATATDVDAGQTKTFSLINAPAGATINATSGLFSWKPTTTGNYTFKVRVTDNGTPALYDEEQITVSVTQSLLAGTRQAAQLQTATPSEAGIYPNPVQDKFYVTLPGVEGKVTISLTNMMGSIISTSTYNTTVNGRIELNGSKLSRGMYLLQIEAGSGKQVLKLIKE